MTFRVGQKVVCIKRDPWIGGYGDEIDPEYSVVYTVRDISQRSRGPCIRLFEIRNNPRVYDELFGECDFDARAFRPVAERETDISVFTRMLKPSKVDA